MEGLVLATIGKLELMKMELVPSDDHQAEIHNIERDIDALEKITGTDAVIKAKLAEIKHLESLPFSPDHYEPVPQGIKIAKHWETLDSQGKGSFLRTWGLKIRADRSGITGIELGNLWYSSQRKTLQITASTEQRKKELPASG